MNLTQLEKKLDEHYQKISESISEYTKSIEARLTEQVQTNKQLQKKLDKSEGKRRELEMKAKDADKWEKKYYRLKETGGSGKTERKIRTVTRYTAYVVFNGRPMEVGTYDNKEDAYAAEKRAAKELAKRIRDAEKKQNESKDIDKNAATDTDLTTSLQKTLKDSYNELKRYAAELEQDAAAKDKEIERLHAELTNATHTKPESTPPDISDWKGQHDDLLEKYEHGQIQITRLEKNAEFDRKEAQARIDNLLKQLRTEQQRADYHGKRDHYLTELFKLG